MSIKKRQPLFHLFQPKLTRGQLLEHKVTLLDFGKFADRIFKMEPHVIFVSVVDNRNTVIAHEIRTGASLHYPSDYIRSFVQVAPVMIMGALEKLKPALGVVESVTVRYEQRLLLFTRCYDMVVVLGLDPSTPTLFADSTTELVRKMAVESEEEPIVVNQQ